MTQKKHSRFKYFAKKLVSKTIIFREDKTTIVAPWFSSVSYTDGAGVIKASFDPKLKPLLIQLKSEFVQAKLPTLLSFRSKYSSRLFLLLKSDYDKQKKFKSNLFVIYDLDFLHTNFELPKSYKAVYKNFKEKFLLKAIEEINEKTEFDINFKELKTGRKITSIQFCIAQKPKESEYLDTDNLLSVSSSVLQEKRSPQTNETTRKELFDMLPITLSKDAREMLVFDCLFDKRDIFYLLQEYSFEDIEDITSTYCSSYEKIKNKQAFVRSEFKKIKRKKEENFDFFR